MGINYGDGLYDDSGYRIRCMDSLIKQLETDYDDLKSSLKMLKNNAGDISKLDEIVEKISWIKKELKMLEKLEMANIEGVLCSESAKIKRDIMPIETGQYKCRNSNGEFIAFLTRNLNRELVWLKPNEDIEIEEWYHDPRWVCKDCGGSFIDKPITCTCGQGIYNTDN